MLSIGDSKVSKLYLGDTECKKAYLGNTLVFEKIVPPKYAAGIDWWHTTLPSSLDCRGLAYGNGKFVIAGYKPKDSEFCSSYSYDGKNWNFGNLPVDNWGGLAYGNGKFVAIAYAEGKTAYSEDGISWAINTVPNTTAKFSEISFANNKFMISGIGGPMFWSVDGVNWELQAEETDAYNKIIYGNDTYICVSQSGYGSTLIYTSKDAITWDVKRMSMKVIDATFGNGVFALATNSESDSVLSDNIFLSNDGVSWETIETGYVNKWGSISFGDGMFALLSKETSGKSYREPYAIYSKNGTDWHLANNSYPGNWTNICYGNGVFVSAPMRDSDWNLSSDIMYSFTGDEPLT